MALTFVPYGFPLNNPCIVITGGAAGPFSISGTTFLAAGLPALLGNSRFCYQLKSAAANGNWYSWGLNATNPSTNGIPMGNTGTTDSALDSQIIFPDLSWVQPTFNFWFVFNNGAGGQAHLVAGQAF